MKREKFTFLILLVEIIAISFLHVAKNDSSTTPQTVVKKQPARVSYQWNNNFTLIRLK